jgi:hypothetical protein
MKISILDLLEIYLRGGGPILDRYDGSVMKAIKASFPEIVFNFDEDKLTRTYYNERKLLNYIGSQLEIQNTFKVIIQ